MDKRYQVFVSSTYADLQEERREVIQTLIEMDCIPSGMELFPAADEEQFEFIKKVIDDCDYYLLIIAGRYGSLDPDGISFTEKEYDYAVEKGLKVIAFIHENPDNIPAGKTDIDPVLRAKLESFKEKVRKNRLVKFWSKTSELPGLVSLSLQRTIKMFPAVGWVRANTTSKPESLEEINNLRKMNDDLRAQIALSKEAIGYKIPNLAEGDDLFEMNGTYTRSYDSRSDKWKTTKSWNDIFSYIGPYLIGQYEADATIRAYLAQSAFEVARETGYSPYIDDQVFQTVKVQLLALGLVKIESFQTVRGGMGLFWSLTEKGKALVMSLRSVKKRP